MELSFLILFLFGALGSIVRDILEDNKLKLPKISDGNFFLGSIGGMITGGIAGYLVDNNPLMAFMAGYSGNSIIQNLLTKNNEQNLSVEKLNEAIIRKIANEECVDPDLAVRVARCESGLNHKAKNINPDGSCDRGLFQINDKYHPEVSDDEAYNPIFSTKFFCKAFKNGNLSWWNVTRKCWEKEK